MKLKTLLTSATTLCAVSLLAAPQASAQAPVPPAKPNILVIFGDDIGLWNISAYNRGMMGYRTPNIDRIAREGAIFTDHYGQQSCTAGRAAFITGQSLLPHRPAQGRPAGRDGRAVGEGPDARRPAEAAGLRHRPVRQEPPRRPQRVPADGARLRRVLRQPLPPQRRGGAGEPRLSEGPDVQGEVRPARRAEVQGQRQGRRRPTIRASAGSASRRSRTPARSPRSAWRRSTRSSSPPRSTSSTGQHEAEQAVLLLVQLHPHAHLHASQEGVRRARPASASTPTAWSSIDGMVGQLLKKLDDLGHRRQHHRHLDDRQRRGGHHLAGRRHHAVPRREEHQLGRRLPRARP